MMKPFIDKCFDFSVSIYSTEHYYWGNYGKLRTIHENELMEEQFELAQNSEFLFKVYFGYKTHKDIEDKIKENKTKVVGAYNKIGYRCSLPCGTLI